MDFPKKQLILLIASTWCFFILLLLLLSRKDRKQKQELKVFFLEDLYGIGHYLRRKLKWEDRKRLERSHQLVELYSPSKAGAIAEQAGVAGITYCVVLPPVFLCLFALSGSYGILLLGLIFIGFLSFYFDLWLKDLCKKRQERLQSEFASMLTKMALMVQVGITVSEAFERVAYSSTGPLYKEMQQTVSLWVSGMPVEEALDQFSLRCPLRGIKKFVSLYKQNRLKGGPDFPIALNEMASDAWIERKNMAKSKGELADQKLLVPTLFMFIGILLMVIVPAFQNLF